MTKSLQQRHKSIGRSLRRRRVDAKNKSNDATKRSSFQFTASKINNLLTSLPHIKMLLIEEYLSIALLTIPVGTLVKNHFSQINQHSPSPRGTQVCQAEGFRLYKQASVRSGKVSPGTKELLF